MKQTFTYIVSWTITVMAYVPCKSLNLIQPEVGRMNNFICSESDQKSFSIGFLNRDSALLVYRRAINNEIITAKFDSIQNK